MRFDYHYRRNNIGPWWCHVVAWRNRARHPRAYPVWASGDRRFYIVALTHDQRYILYAMLAPWRYPSRLHAVLVSLKYDLWSKSRS